MLVPVHYQHASPSIPGWSQKYEHRNSPLITNRSMHLVVILDAQTTMYIHVAMCLCMTMHVCLRTIHPNHLTSIKTEDFIENHGWHAVVIKACIAKQNWWHSITALYIFTHNRSLYINFKQLQLVFLQFRLAAIYLCKDRLCVMNTAQKLKGCFNQAVVTIISK